MARPHPSVGPGVARRLRTSRFLVRTVTLTGIGAVLMSGLSAPAPAQAAVTEPPTNVVAGAATLTDGLAHVPVTFDAPDTATVAVEFDDTDTFATPQQGTATSPTAATISAAPGTRIYFHTRTVPTDGREPSAWTATEPVLLPINGPHSLSIAPDSSSPGAAVDLTWTDPTTPAPTVAPGTAVVAQASTTDTFETISAETSAPVTATSGRTLLTGLPADTDMFVRVQLRTVDNTSPWVNATTQTRPETVTAATPALHVTGVEHVEGDTYKVTIADSGDRAWVNTTRWLKADGTTVAATNIDPPNTGVTSAREYTLNLDGNHPVTIAAAYCYGDCAATGDVGPMSAPLTFTSPPPAPAENVTATRTSDSTADVSWTAAGGTPDRWHVKWTNGAGDIFDVDVPGDTTAATLPATPYTDPGLVSVQAFDANGLMSTVVSGTVPARDPPVTPEPTPSEEPTPTPAPTGTPSAGTGELRGTVTRAGTNAPVAGSNITACETSTSECLSTSTDEDGGYVLPGIPVGTYLTTARDSARWDTSPPSQTVNVTDGAAATVNLQLRAFLIITGKLSGIDGQPLDPSAHSSAPLPQFLVSATCGPDNRYAGGTGAVPLSTNATYTMGVDCGVDTTYQVHVWDLTNTYLSATAPQGDPGTVGFTEERQTAVVDVELTLGALSPERLSIRVAPAFLVVATATSQLYPPPCPTTPS